MSVIPTIVPRQAFVEGLGLGSVAHDLHNLLASLPSPAVCHLLLPYGHTLHYSLWTTQTRSPES